MKVNPKIILRPISFDSIIADVIMAASGLQKNTIIRSPSPISGDLVMINNRIIYIIT